MELTINKFLVKKLSVSGKQAMQILQEKRVLINSIQAIQMQVITQEDFIQFDDQILQEADPYFYIAYYKPRGMECTMDPLIENNLSKALPINKHYFPIGRLDKESEGLLILTNDGYLYIKIAPPGVFVEKEYIVTVDKIINDEMILRMSEGIEIMGEVTRPCQMFKIDDYTFRIILTQGLNRQIRRMCYKLDYEVTSLKRIRIKSVGLGSLKPGEFQEISREIII